ncbi:putative phosphatase regulatory subunit-domain-containing protein [Aspergillus ambiguus]|uniref:protein phosphatase regulator GAC1 n=1 Tax=Aspergillus ambiguus TaxID=176160 RepID=UPI003CCD8A9A
MPYTAPLKQSPSAQHIENLEPTSHSCPSSPALGRSKNPHRSRAYSTTSYTRKHRRSPSTNKTFAAPAPTSSTNPSPVKHAVDGHGSIRQSPPPISEARIPPGALISPPESGPNSSDDETSSYRKRDGLQLEELEEAVRSIEQRRVSSPERKPSEMQPSSSQTSQASTHANGTKPARPPLSKEARKISHSRSATETSVPYNQEQALTSSPEESDRDDEPQRRHPMVRKKSGELVRPALRPPSARRRPSSMPGTPTYSKAVHFDSQLEHIRHFLQVDKPQAVSAGTSPVDDHDAEGEFPFANNGSQIRSFEWDLRLPNFPHDTSRRSNQRVRLERLYLSPDKTTLVGMVAVANLAFQKLVAARFTFDFWKTISEVTAEYHHDVRRKQVHDGYDRFCFSIKLDEQANLERKTMLICIRYNVDGQEFWDNNNSMNYQVKFLKVPVAKAEPSRLGARPTPATRVPLPRSRTFASFGTRPHSIPSFDDFSHMEDYLSFGRPNRAAKDRSLCEDASHDEENMAPIRRDKQSHQVFGTRYDFESSLSAAMRNKATHDRTTLAARAKSENGPDSKKQASLDETDLTVGKCTTPATEISSSPSLPNNSRPSSLVSSKPHRESSVYKELVDKYCFFGSPDLATSGGRNPAPGSDMSSARRDSSSSSSSVSPCSSPILSPRSDGSRDNGSRNASSSPNQFGYPYLQHMQRHFLKDAHTPTVIQG